MRTFEPAGNPGPHNRPLTGGEIILVVIVMIIAAALTVAGLPAFGIAELLGGTAVCVLRLLRSSSSGSAGPVQQG